MTISTRAFTFLTFTLLVLLCSATVLFRAWRTSQNSYTRVVRTNAALHTRLKHIQGEHGRLIAQNLALELKRHELEALIPELVSEVKSLGVRLRRSESISTSSFQVHSPVTTVLRDSVVFDTTVVKVFDYSDGYFQVQGLATAQSQHLKLSYQDTLVQVVYRGPRERPWLWIFSKRKLYQRVSLKNPNAQIQYSRHIEIQK